MIRHLKTGPGHKGPYCDLWELGYSGRKRIWQTVTDFNFERKTTFCVQIRDMQLKTREKQRDRQYEKHSAFLL